MKKNIVYVLGLLEDEENSLFQYFKNELKNLEINLNALALYTKNKFGNESFIKSIQQTEEFIYDTKPEMIIAHSLGAYTLIQTKVNCPVILLDPSRSIIDIVLNNLKQYNKSYFYYDGKYDIRLSPMFLKSIKLALPIKKCVYNISSKDIRIYGAGKGGYKIAEQYHKYIPYSQYVFFSKADHEFSNKDDREQILITIKKWLNN